MVLPVGDVNPTRRRAVVTGLLVVINLGVFVGLQTPLQGCDEAAFVYRFSVIPRELTTGAALGPDALSTVLGPCSQAAVGKSVVLSVLTAMFLHGNLAHLLGNLLFLWVFGNNVEDRLGRLRFLAFYLGGGAAATLAFTAFHPTSSTPLIGASGAIAAILGAYLVLFPRATVVTYAPFPLYLVALVLPAARIRAFFVLFAIVTLPAWLVLGGWFVLQALAARSTLSDQIAYEAHLGGFVAGIVLLLLLDRRRARRGQVPFHPRRGR